MATGQTSEVIQRLRRTVLLRDGAGLTDGQLLESYISRRDEAALAALVRRHAPMVWGVCRRILGNHHDAEVAFQAAFLVLVRKAASIAKRELLANWLYGVAHQTALKRAATVAKRRDRERQVTEMPEPQHRNQESGVRSQDWDDLQPLLDEELSRLPDKYRVVIVLCDLEEKSRKEAARQLACPEGTVAGRLARARVMLAKRLAERGVAMSGGALAAVLAQNVASAGVPATVVFSTIRAATLFAAGQAATGVISTKVAALTEEVLTNMLLSKLKSAAAALVVLAIVAMGAGGLLGVGSHETALGDSSSSAGSGQEAQAPAAKRTGPGRLLLVRNSDFVALNPDGKEENQWPNPGKTRYRLQGRLSPDGSRAACVVIAGEERKPGDFDGGWRFKVVIRNLDTREEKAVDFTGRGLWLRCWRPDGKRLVVWHWMDDGQAKHILVDPDSGKTEPLDLPAGMLVLDWAREDTFLVEYDKDQKHWLGMLEKGNKEARPLTTWARARNLDARLSPDGTRVLFTDFPRSPDGKRVLLTDALEWDMSSQPYILDVLTGKRQPLADFPKNAEAQSVAWSPDGKRIAYTWWQLHPDLLKKWDMLGDNDRARPTQAFLVIADADGRNSRIIASERTNRILGRIFGSVDWR